MIKKLKKRSLTKKGKLISKEKYHNNNPYFVIAK